MGGRAQRDAVSRLADSLTPPRPRSVSSFENAVVTAYSGTAPDGHTLATVQMQTGEVLQLAYPDSYTPVVGHSVLVLIQNDVPSIICRLVGAP